jgi:type IV secretory pathway VirD2 relaxase
MTDKFEPWLGRIGDRGRVDERLFRQKARKAEAFLGRVRAKTRFTGAALGRGGASARALSAHLGYIQRDGVKRGGSGGELYGREGAVPDADGFAARCEEDRHQLRFIVSAEDAGQLGDLKETTRALMAQMEADLWTRLDWLSVDHHNTGHPNTHIVIRGKDADDRDLVIAPEYIKQALGSRAQDIVTERVGPRRDFEIAQARQREVTQERFTGLDRSLLAEASEY